MESVAPYNMYRPGRGRFLGVEFSDVVSLAALAVSVAAFLYARQSPVRQSQRELHAQIRQQTDLLLQVLQKAQAAAKSTIRAASRDPALKEGIETLERWTPRLQDRQLRDKLQTLQRHTSAADDYWRFCDEVREQVGEEEERLSKLTNEHKDLRAVLRRSVQEDAQEYAVSLAVSAEQALTALHDVQTHLTTLEHKP